MSKLKLPALPVHGYKILVNAGQVWLRTRSENTEKAARKTAELLRRNVVTARAGQILITHRDWPVVVWVWADEEWTEYRPKGGGSQ